jgi:pSer/pThr/pTyr-binding forkhead associated (FHA) protein
MGEGKSPTGSSRGPAGHDATRLESVDDIRRAFAGQPLATVLEHIALPADQGAMGTRLESAEEIRRLLASQRPATVLENVPPREGTRLESVEEIRKALAESRTPTAANVAPNSPGAMPFRPARRPPMAVLTICDDGKTEGEQVRLRGDRAVIGRGDGDVRIPHDAMMSTRHAEIVREADQNGWQWSLVDLQSTNGSFVRVPRATFKHGAEFLVGSTVLRFEDAALNLPGAALETGTALPTKTQGWQTMAPTDLKASLVHVTPQGLGKRFFLDSAEQWLGRDAGQAAIALTEDVQVESRHAKVARDAKGNWSIEDAGSRNGVWLRVQRHALDGVCEFQLGEQRFIVRVGAT